MWIKLAVNIASIVFFQVNCGCCLLAGPKSESEFNQSLRTSITKAFNEINKNWSYVQSASDLKTNSAYWELKATPQKYMNSEGNIETVTVPALYFRPTELSSIDTAIDDFIRAL